MIPEEPPHLTPGYRLDRYELLSPLGAGGMASVWVARLLGKHDFEKLVALKMILPHYAHDPRFQQMFLDEARIAARIQHLNVAQILDLGEHEGILFLAMEWVDGDALSTLVQAVRQQGAPFPPGIAMRILADVCAGLHAAHELRDRAGAPLGVVHRDISPQNILLGPLGVAKVIDFGVAKARDRAAGETETGSIKGKLKYMAPEQAFSPKSTDRRADVWAVGAVLYALLAGRAPYESESDAATLLQLAQAKPLAPLLPRIPVPVRRVVARALAWEPAARYSTAAELRAAFEDAMAASAGSTTNADVAAFCERHLGSRAAVRREAVSRALVAAEERSRVLHARTRPGDRSASRSGDYVAPEVPSTPQEPTPTLGGAGAMTTNLAGPPDKTRRWQNAVVAGAIAAAVAAIAVVAGTTALVRGAAPRGGARAIGALPATVSAVKATAPAEGIPLPAPLPRSSVETPQPAARASVSADAILSAAPSARPRSQLARTPDSSRDPSSATPAAATKRAVDYGF